MMQGIEPEIVDEYIYTKLIEDTDLMSALGGQAGVVNGLDQVYSDTVPPDVVYPYLIYQMQSNSDSMTTDSTRVLWIATYLVKGVDRAESYTGLKTIASRIDVRLHKASGVVADGMVLHSARVGVIRYPEITDAVNYRHRGGSYRFWTQAT